MIPFLDLKRINEIYKDELINSAIDVIKSGRYLNGAELKNFESLFSNYIGSKHVIGVSNGLDALRLIIRGYIELGKLKEGDEIMLPANTFIASIIPIIEFKLKPILVEIDPVTYNINFSDAISKINDSTKAIIIVHLYGRVCWEDEFFRVFKEKNIIIIEDNAQAIGASFNNIKTGNLGDAAAFSFYPGKNLGALGDAGAVTTNDSKLSYIVRTLSNYGSSKKYLHDLLGYNCRLDEIQAVFLSKKLNRIDQNNDFRKKIALNYISSINNNKVKLPALADHIDQHVWHLFVVQVDDRLHFQKYLMDNGIETLIHYPLPIHKQNAVKIRIKLPKAERHSKRCLSLPLYPTLKQNEINHIIEVINNY
tara:strand:+ start:4733 stop:5827 length:1095 start_codon:yes stop_codon:yes gene_type:complete